MSEIVVYSTGWCGDCTRLKRVLEREGVPFREVDIEHDAAAAQFVAGVNGGNRTVPTVVFPDGRVATNPTVPEVLAQLRAGA